MSLHLYSKSILKEFLNDDKALVENFIHRRNKQNTTKTVEETLPIITNNTPKKNLKSKNIIKNRK